GHLGQGGRAVGRGGAAGQGGGQAPDPQGARQSAQALRTPPPREERLGAREELGQAHLEARAVEGAGAQALPMQLEGLVDLEAQRIGEGIGRHVAYRSAALRRRLPIRSTKREGAVTVASGPKPSTHCSSSTVIATRRRRSR